MLFYIVKLYRQESKDRSMFFSKKREREREKRNRKGNVKAIPIQSWTGPGVPGG